MKRVLLWLSGVDQDVLARCRTEQVRYAALGGTVLTTATMAAVSSACCLRYAVRAPFVVCLLGAVLWAAAILNLDRLLVASVGRGGVGHRLAGLLPRLALAGLLGLVIAEPLVLRLFQPEIDQQLGIEHRAAKAAYVTTLADDPRYTEIPSLRRSIARLQATVASGGAHIDAQVDADPSIQDLRADVAAKERVYLSAERAVVCEKEGISVCPGGIVGSGKVGPGIAYREKVRIRDEAERALVSAENALARERARLRPLLVAARQRTAAQASAALPRLRERLAVLTRERQSDVDDYTTRVDHDNGLLARVEALSVLTNAHPVLAWVHWLLAALVTTVDSLPVLLTLLLSFGTAPLYERLVATEEEQAAHHERVHAEARRRVSELSAETLVDTARAQHDVDVDAARSRAEYATEARERLARHAIDVWEARVRADMDADIDAYIDDDVVAI